jgi:nucleotide-binding universal stress UspA family protein
MKRFKNILLVTHTNSWEKAALGRAAELAERNRARLTVVGVLRHLPQEMQRLVVSMTPVDLQQLAMQDLRERLNEFVAPIRSRKVPLGVEVLCGTPFLEIIRDVLRHERDLVMLTAQAKSRLKEFFFGSTALHLMRKCPCPVWVIKPIHRKPFARILAAVDPDPSDPVKNALNMKILELATSLAELEQSTLHIIHAWSHFAEDSLRYGGIRLPKPEVDKIIREERGKHKSGLDELLRKFALERINHQVHLVKGHAGEAIAELATTRRAELIVMGTLCRTGIEGFLMGNTAETVLRHVDCSVLTVKPDGFVTPVRLEAAHAPV